MKPLKKTQATGNALEADGKGTHPLKRMEMKCAKKSLIQIITVLGWENITKYENGLSFPMVGDLI